MKFAAPVSFLVFCAFSANAKDRFFVHTDENGTVHVARNRLSDEYQPLLLGSEVTITAPLSKRVGLRAELSTWIRQLAKENGVAYELVDAIILAESGYDPAAVSTKGAVGLMQLMPATAKRLGVADRTDPRENVRGGVKYLKWLLDRYRKVDLAIAAFNAGEGAVDTAGGIPNFLETKQYVQRVLSIIGENIK